ncbi:hypothetical protein MtrunA17_Chr5g0443641 [Medicago truncatula]|uniref:Uncharacterized protein n=1 Tax=Medicago truncatula TaxID=3880 RepID=G7K3G3_MEDTR|nr:hypothetical protein MTR_5g092070 [Medicago truncatula]RHN57735.1 hypothetical protein MtrunA17_Chr5g0443641 [Medicago truncatula]
MKVLVGMREKRRSRWIEQDLEDGGDEDGDGGVSTSSPEFSLVWSLSPVVMMEESEKMSFRFSGGLGRRSCDRRWWGKV